eukprot:10903249-Heterocapsa_arctica.AAC.1
MSRVKMWISPAADSVATAWKSVFLVRAGGAAARRAREPHSGEEPSGGLKPRSPGSRQSVCLQICSIMVMSMRAPASRSA